MRDLQERCQTYLAGRRARYEDRRSRFGAVGQLLLELGLAPGDVIYDLGAGHCQFDYFLRVEMRWRGVYVPVDGAIDGTDLDTWTPFGEQADFYILMETLEHLHEPMLLLERLQPRKGIVLTTPNEAVVRTLEVDEDHRSVVPEGELRLAGFEIVPMNMFGKAGDTLLAWRRGDARKGADDRGEAGGDGAGGQDGGEPGA